MKKLIAEASFVKLILVLLLLSQTLALTETGTYDQAKAALDKLGNSDFAEQCRKLAAGEYAKCIAHQNWELDIQATMINHGTGQNELVDMLIQGDNDCPYTSTVGDSIPLEIKGESIDQQGNKIEIVCSVYCYSWNCPQEEKINLKDEANVIATVNRGIDAFPSSLTSLLKDQKILLLVDEKPYSAVFAGTKLTAFQPGAPEKPTLRIVTSSKALEEVANAVEPIPVVVQAINKKEIVIIGHTLGNKIITTLGSISARTYSRQLAQTYTVPPNEQRPVTIEGRSATLTQNSLGQRIVSLPEETRVVTSYGRTQGYTTPGAQHFVQQNPARYSSSAGIYYQPAQSYYDPAAARSFEPNWNTFNSGSGLIILGGGGRGGAFRG